MISDRINFLSEKRLELGPWQAFERCLARLLQHGGFKDVKVVGGTGDLGADVLATRGKKLYVIQAKFRNSGTIGKKAVQEAINAMQEYGTDVCITATNRFFSSDARSFNKEKQDLGFKTYLWNRDFILNQSSEIAYYSRSKRKPRPYQQTAIDAIFKALELGSNKGLLTLATGLGKTVIASTFISDFLEENPSSNVLVLAHMSDLVRQLDEASWRQFSSDIETHVWTGGERPAFLKGVIFATWQSVLSAMTNGEIEKKQFELIIVDECHHAPSESFSKILNELEPEFLLGVTATPWRGDNTSLKYLFGEPLFSMNVVEGMLQGYLSKVDYKMLTDGIDWQEINYLSKNGHTVKDLNERLYIPERDRGMVEEIVSTINATDNPRALVFCRSIKHAERLLVFFKMYDIKTSVLHSNLSRTERFNALAGFRTGKITALISIEMLNEGIDVPEVNIVCFARVTHSRRIFLQQLGRGLRLSDNKKEVKVLDFVADIRRVAEGVAINNEAKKFHGEEIINYPKGQIVQFSSDARNFFDQYLEDMSDISNLDESARLEFPD